MDYDAVILGAGPAGAVAALVLARAGYRVCIIDLSKQGFRGGESLAPSAQPLLRRLGLTAEIARGPHLPCYGNMSSWGSNQLWSNDFLHSQWGHGWHLDRAAFDGLILARARAAGADVLTKTRFLHADDCQDPDGSKGHRVTWQVLEGKETETRQTRWIIDATGHARAFLRRQGVAIERVDRQVARVASFRLPSTGDGLDAPDPDTRSLVEADADGWWYTARIPGGRRIVMFFSDDDQGSFRAYRDRDALLKAILATGYVGEPLHRWPYQLVGEPLVKTVTSARAATVVGDHWLAVGDAAVSFDPLSSQGVVSALRSGEEAAGALVRTLAGDPSGLVRYQQSMDTLWTDTLEERAKYYAMERRWSNRPFWRRRAG